MGRIATLLACTALALTACGEEDDSSEYSFRLPDTASSDRTQTAAKPLLNSPAARRRPEPVTRSSGDRLPTRAVVIRDLKRGAGAALEPGDAIEVNFVEFDPKTGKKTASTWRLEGTHRDNFGTGEVVEGWESGLKGMRVGGRRELIAPPHLAYDAGPVGYVVDLIAITPRSG